MCKCKKCKKKPDGAKVHRPPAEAARGTIIETRRTSRARGVLLGLEVDGAQRLRAEVRRCRVHSPPAEAARGAIIETRGVLLGLEVDGAQR
jgi:hypothetical protein